ncbi:MAG: hypothetical protein K9M82_02250 [Deltaproteobacteria bacterium]|nr:hypothetical protein [Deltaproteobacteria bacterium]
MEAAGFLLRFLNDHGTRFETIYIHTGGSGPVDNHGLSVFRQGLEPLDRISWRLKFVSNR